MFAVASAMAVVVLDELAVVEVVVVDGVILAIVSVAVIANIFLMVVELVIVICFFSVAVVVFD